MEQFILHEVATSGKQIPESIELAPELSLGLELYFNAFIDLSGSRQVGMSHGRIPWVVIQGYADYHCLDVDQCEAMHHHLGRMDSIWLKYQEKKDG